MISRHCPNAVSPSSMERIVTSLNGMNGYWTIIRFNVASSGTLKDWLMPSTNGHGAKNAGSVALCLRVSSEEQRDRESIEIQRDFLTKYCELYNLEVADVYADDGVSGTIPLHDRPEGRRCLLEDAKEGKFQTLLVYRLDSACGEENVR